MDGGNAGPQRATAPVCSVVGFFLGLAATSGYFFVTITPCWYVSYAEATVSCATDTDNNCFLVKLLSTV